MPNQHHGAADMPRHGTGEGQEVTFEEISVDPELAEELNFALFLEAINEGISTARQEVFAPASSRTETSSTAAERKESSELQSGFERAIEKLSVALDKALAKLTRRHSMPVAIGALVGLGLVSADVGARSSGSSLEAEGRSAMSQIQDWVNAGGPEQTARTAAQKVFRELLLAKKGLETTKESLKKIADEEQKKLDEEAQIEQWRKEAIEQGQEQMAQTSEEIMAQAAHPQDSVKSSKPSVSKPGKNVLGSR